jgi:hypothetical protein
MLLRPSAWACLPAAVIASLAARAMGFWAPSIEAANRLLGLLALNFNVIVSFIGIRRHHDAAIRDAPRRA